MTSTHLRAVSLCSGLHFNILEGRPVSPASDVSTLLDKNGFFLDKTAMRRAAEEHRVDVKQVRLLYFAFN